MCLNPSEVDDSRERENKNVKPPGKREEREENKRYFTPGD